MIVTFVNPLRKEREEGTTYRNNGERENEIEVVQREKDKKRWEDGKSRKKMKEKWERRKREMKEIL